jgi:ribonuclease D
MDESATGRRPPATIRTRSALAEAAAGWRDARVLGIDTEFVRTQTFFHRLGLVQVADAETSWLVDPLALQSTDDLSPLAEVLASPALKVLHSASEDVEVFYRALGTVPAPLFDTQIAAALAGFAPYLSYQKLVSEVLGIEISKDETRTDWMARPLSPAQLAYAAADVAHLVPLHGRLRQELETLGRYEWALEDSMQQLDTARFDDDPQRAYLRIKGAGRLDRRKLAALRLLAAWREGEARRRDLPRNFVLKEDFLLTLALRSPRTVQDLERLPGCDRRLAARDGAVWLELLAAARALPDLELPPLVVGSPPTAALRKLEERLRETVRRRATDLGIAPEVLAPRRLWVPLLRSAESGTKRLPRELDGWRREAIGELLLRELAAPG